MQKYPANSIQCLHPLRFCADFIESVVNTKTEEILYQKASTSRPPPKIILKDAWQVQRDDSHQRGAGIGKPDGSQSSRRPTSKIGACA